MTKPVESTMASTRSGDHSTYRSNSDRPAYRGNADRFNKPSPAPAAPQINIKAVSTELSQRFTDVTRSARNNSKGTHLYDWQVEFSYLMDNIQRGPKYIVPKYVSIAHHFINTVDAAIKTQGFNNMKPVAE